MSNNDNKEKDVMWTILWLLYTIQYVHYIQIKHKEKDVIWIILCLSDWKCDIFIKQINETKNDLHFVEKLLEF